MTADLTRDVMLAETKYVPTPGAGPAGQTNYQGTGWFHPKMKIKPVSSADPTDNGSDENVDCPQAAVRGNAMARRKDDLTSSGVRLKEQAERDRARAANLPPGPERDALLRKARQAETAAHAEQWAS